MRQVLGERRKLPKLGAHDRCAADIIRFPLSLYYRV
jgi:hypothetical protein